MEKEIFDFLLKPQSMCLPKQDKDLSLGIWHALNKFLWIKCNKNVFSI